MPRVVHFEVNADKPDRAIKFYQGVFGWKIEKWPGPIEYWTITTGDDKSMGINGGLTKRRESKFATVNYIGVPALDEYVAKVKKMGGQILQPKTEVMGIGFIAVCQDTEGNIFGIIEPKMAQPK